MIRFSIGIIIFAFALLKPFQAPIDIILFVVAYLVFGADVILTALRNILKGDFFDENFLMSIATVGAFALGEYPEAVAVMLFYQIGEILQDIAVDRSRKSIKAIMDIRPDFAHKVTNEGVQTVDPYDIVIGDYILVKPGEKIPLDGTIEEGKSQLDTRALTGETVPRSVKIGDEVLSGCINQIGVLKIKVTKNFAESTVTKILELVENASSKKAPTEKFITKFARYYTPVVVFIALAVAIIPSIVTPQADFKMWLSRALIMLVISCPCAIVVSIPLGFFSGIGIASSKGILIKGSNYLQALNEVTTVVFDKTGTLTEGVFEVVTISPESNCSSQEIIKYAAIAEYHSTHPIAQSIIEKYNSTNSEPITENIIDSYEEIAGYGVYATIADHTILVGNSKLMEKNGLDYKKFEGLGTVLYIAIDRQYAGYIVISDKIKADSKVTVEKLKSIGVKNIAMLTGDRATTAQAIANEIGIDKVYSELLPTQKVEILEQLMNQRGGKVIFVGDGINDAPVIARADIGIAMGGTGSDAAVEAADIVIMQDQPSKVFEAIQVGRHTNKIVWQNVIFSLGIKIIVLILGAFGFANMWLAVFADVGVTLLAVMNSMRKG
jgi:Cd2+/Zn2+-exporting ATPase